MKSRISIEVDFDNSNQPIIQILQSSDSDDVRDKLLSHFCQQFGGSSWCQIKWQLNSPDGFNRIFISPIKPNQFKDQANIMLDQHNLNLEFKGKDIKPTPKENVGNV